MSARDTASIAICALHEALHPGEGAGSSMYQENHGDPEYRWCVTVQSSGPYGSPYMRANYYAHGASPEQATLRLLVAMTAKVIEVHERTGPAIEKAERVLGLLTKEMG